VWRVSSYIDCFGGHREEGELGEDVWELHIVEKAGAIDEGRGFGIHLCVIYIRTGEPIDHTVWNRWRIFRRSRQSGSCAYQPGDIEES